MARLTKLHIENFKRIQAIEFEPEGPVTIVGGLNEQGKSSLLDSISVLLQGKASKIPEPVRKGTKKAMITGEILKDSWDAFESMTITRTITAAGNWYVKVTDKDGKAFKSPEGMLREIFGDPVDPVEFVKMTSAERVETMKRITGLDFADLDATKKELYDERTLVGREIRQREENIKEMEVYPDAPLEKVSVTALLEKLGERQKVNRVNEHKREELKTIANEITGSEQSLFVMREELQRIQNKIAEAKKTHSNLTDEYAFLEKEIDSLEDANEQEVKDQISKVEETNNQIEANTRAAEEAEKLQYQQTKHKNLTKQIDDIEANKQAQLSKINFPVDGLSFNESDVLYNDLPFDAKQLSSEELLRVSFAIAIAARPNLKNVLIREGSLLDENNLKLIGKMAEDAGIHVFVEVVGDDANKATILIENGEIKPSPIEFKGIKEIEETGEGFETEEEFADI